MPKVLIIEDEESIREEVVEWLTFEGYDTAEAANGRIGVDVALDEIPDMIICDISMPEMDGYQVLMALREHPETKLTPFIFLTARADRTFMRHGMELGADDYLTKPFTRNELLSALNARLNRQSAIAEKHSQQLENAKLELARMIATELKNPVASMQFVNELIDRQIDHLSSDQVRDLLQTLSAGTDRLYHLIEQMVYWTRLEAHLLTRETVQESDGRVYMWQLVPAAINQARRFALRNHDIEVNTSLEDGEASVQGPLEPLRHILAEILANVMNAMPSDGSIDLEQRVVGERSIITIADNKGMDQDNDTSLGVVKRILALYGGHLTLISAAVKGAQVEMVLPLATNEAVQLQ